MSVDILCCSIYDRYLNKMLAERNYVKTNKEKLKIMTKFASKFTLLPEQLSEFARLFERCNQKIAIDEYSTFYSPYYGDKNAKNMDWSNKDDLIIKMYDYTCKNRFQLADELLTFPHKWLDDLRVLRLSFSAYPLPKTVGKQCENSEKIYEKLKKSENDIDKWLDIIKQLENKEAIIANLELKLGQNSNWKNKKLWKFYFGFLKENNRKEILDVFQKYTRLFICDKQAVSQYRNELDKFSSWNIPTTKYWIDTIKYEIEFGTLESAYRILKRALKAVIGKPYRFVVKDKTDLYEKLKMFENEMMEIEELRASVNASNDQTTEGETSLKSMLYYQNPKLQYFCFHQSFMQNILKNAKWTILRKLFATCKFFYAIKKAPLCYRLELRSFKKTSYCHESLFINKNDIDFAGLKNLHLYCILIIRENINRNLVPKILPKLKQCDLRYIHFEKQDFNISELKFMLSEHIFHCLFVDVNIKYESGININSTKLSQILKSYPSLKYLEIINQNYLIVDSCEECINWKKHVQNFRFDTIFIANQTFSFTILHSLIDFEILKSIKLKNITVKNADGSEMDKQQIENFIRDSVNPINNVIVEIV